MGKKEKKGGGWILPRLFFDDDLNRNMRDIWEFPRLSRELISSPRVDIIDEGDSLRVKADLPGVDKDKIKLNVTHNSISISVTTDKEKEEKGKNYYYSERSASGYYRNLQLPSSVDPKTSKARYQNGTLEISIKKSEHGSEITID